ncbi:gamma-butyrobetaine dioxygenase-like [Pecten maximus]|uniref:gamma-butyrobetaine dioxygenase-like n=1 Tax=Pecten maximus TaxID=6579 RepID=UPI001457F6C0|nr:gamma-butyrobetaine dioxygenase-like [Pecten maximus]
MAMLNSVLRTVCRQTVGRCQHGLQLTGPGTTSAPVRWLTLNSKLLSSVQQVQVVDGGKKLNVTWEDGKSFDFHSIWLRFQCPCTSCREESSGLFRTRPADIPLGLKIKEAVKTETGDVQVQWKEEQHHGYFSQDFLHQHIYSKDHLQAKKQVSRPVFNTTKNIDIMPWEDVNNSEKGLYRWLRKLNEDGLAKVSGVPKERDYLEKVIRKIGPIIHTPYGYLFEVATVDDPVNASFTSVALHFHQDLPVYEGQPGIQFLHCLRFDETVKGGVTRFLDMYQVLAKFRVQYPNEFKTLCRVPISIQMEYDNSDYPVLMSKRRPIIYLDDHGEVISVVWHTYMHAPLEVPEEDVEEFYNAYQLLGRAVEFSEDVIETKLKPGEVIAFNNRRMLHARSAYEEGGSGKRHFQGGYLSGDDFKSRLLVLAKKMGDPRPAIRIGNNDWR